MSAISKVLIIEDRQEVIESVTLTFNVRWPQAVVKSTAKGRDGVDMVASYCPDLVILDIGLPDIDGFEVLKRIRLFSSVPVLILTVRSDEAEIVKGLELGADEYIVKPFRQMELLSRVNAIARRSRRLVEDASMECAQFSFDPSTRIVHRDEEEIHLTQTESSILSKLMQNAGMVVSYASLADDIWGTNYPDAVKSLNVYICRLRQKIETDPSQPSLLLNKQGLGYIFIK
ncbi:MAG: response regulator transcription factor [Limnochordia bacterium]|jgi:two-component system KDP operon response regulator KdpE|nr:response regulator transcription factor [Limnochordia bacterium]